MHPRVSLPNHIVVLDAFHEIVQEEIASFAHVCTVRMYVCMDGWMDGWTVSMVVCMVVCTTSLQHYLHVDTVLTTGRPTEHRPLTALYQSAPHK